ncbi:MAG TPA: DNA replication/repair protein RecF, partial [Ktedonobacterales bacterium]
VIWRIPSERAGRVVPETIPCREDPMRIERLRLTDFRNYRALDLHLPGGLVVLRGRNAQGKSNVLEAASIIATSRSFRTTNDRETVRWGAVGHFARVEATVARRNDTLEVEVIITDTAATTPSATGTSTSATASPAPPMPPGGLPFRKRIRVNGAPRRAMDLLGQVTVVIFSPTHLDLVIGAPSERRRFLDMTLCQVHTAYCRQLSQYHKIVTQRAALLRRIRDGEDSPSSLGFWDEQLARLAIPIMRTRAAFLARAEAPAAQLYGALAGDEAGEDEPEGEESVAETDISPAGEDDDASPGPLRLVYQPSYDGPLAGEEAALVAGMIARLGQVRRREIAQGANVLGPHRDDVGFFAGAMDLAIYGSRGQQRSVALALKLAELAYIEAETGDQPILLLDDVLSELDARRRADLLEAVRDLDQVLLTVTDATDVPEEARARATLLHVRAGRVMGG